MAGTQFVHLHVHSTSTALADRGRFAVSSATSTAVDVLPRVAGAELSPVALTIDDEDAFDSKAALRTLAPLDRGSSWWVGDVLVAMGKRYGDTYVVAMRETGMTADALTNRKWLSTAIAHNDPRPELSWSVHRAVATLAADEQRHWLAYAVEHKLSEAELKHAIRNSASGEGADDGSADPEDDDGYVCVCRECGRRLEAA
jgi:hypothetical protein